MDGNGYIDYSEFLKATLDVNKVLSQKNVHMSFKLFDKDGSGKISAQELKQILSPGMENAEEV